MANAVYFVVACYLRLKAGCSLGYTRFLFGPPQRLTEVLNKPVGSAVFCRCFCLNHAAMGQKRLPKKAYWLKEK